MNVLVLTWCFHDGRCKIQTRQVLGWSWSRSNSLYQSHKYVCLNLSVGLMSAKLDVLESMRHFQLETVNRCYRSLIPRWKKWGLWMYLAMIFFFKKIILAGWSCSSERYVGSWCIGHIPWKTLGNQAGHKCCSNSIKSWSGKLARWTFNASVFIPNK